jgi:hypothetical protein
MTKQVSRPFLPDISDKDRIINQGVEQLRLAHKQRVESHRLECVARAEREYLRAEQRRHDAFVTKWLEDNYVRKSYPYGDLSPAGQYRVSLEPDKRLDGLAAVQEWSELLYCLLARGGSSNKAPIDKVKAWFKPYVAVDGDYSILVDRDFPDRTYTTDQPTHSNVIIHAKELSKQLADILTDTWMIEVRFGQVVWKERDIERSEY